MQDFKLKRSKYRKKIKTIQPIILQSTINLNFVNYDSLQWIFFWDFFNLKYIIF